ncbi:hypothetical protein A1Q2_01326 [Trichosporon asahii var. asahii CBS 8904]|uniref:Uncharacterized protein n=1 Tax=Trichosporon asahii var. asahii (strain CBS 8904) TaxID=1220162 RepID=K1VJI8_TRIAC|nr:hypothetical protein A1Q2_01326 [Trichosporon asahii var. asahii CBS 8904]
MDGYIPMRDRQGFVKSDGWKVPQFWEIERSGVGGPVGLAVEGGKEVNGAAEGSRAVGVGAGVQPVNGAGEPGGRGSTAKADVKGEEEWVETTETDGREADRIGGQMVDVGQRATLPAPSADTAVGSTAAVCESAPPAAIDKQSYGARDLLEMPPLDQVLYPPTDVPAAGTALPQWHLVHALLVDSNAESVPSRLNVSSPVSDLVPTPVSIIPAPEEIVLPAKPLSSIPYFPNFVSYRKEQFEVRPPRFADPESVRSLAGESVDVVFAIRMPSERIECPPGVDEEDLEVVREWGGLELGVTKVEIR